MTGVATLIAIVTFVLEVVWLAAASYCRRNPPCRRQAGEGSMEIGELTRAEGDTGKPRTAIRLRRPYQTSNPVSDQEGGNAMSSNLSTEH